MEKPKRKKGPDTGEAMKEQKLLALARSLVSRKREEPEPERAPEPLQDPDIHLRAPKVKLPKPEMTKDGFAMPLSMKAQKKSQPKPLAPPPSKKKGPLPPPPKARSTSTSKSSSKPPSKPRTSSLPLNYTPPFWSELPEEEFGFDILKNGIIVQSVPMNTKPYLVIGRHPSCELVLQHPSISRQHCVLQHREGGLLYLYELGSTHGTKVNKQKIPKREHFQVNIGDVIKFGESSRLYIVTGPEKYAPAVPERQLPEHVRLKIAQTKQKRMEEKKKEHLQKQMEITEMNWGMGDEDRQAQMYEDKDPLEDFKPKTERQKKLWERIEAKEKKIENIKGEMLTLSKKRSVQGELSEGQTYAMQRCEKRIEQLKEIVESIKDTLRDELDLAYRRSTGASLKKRRQKLMKQRRKAAQEDSDDEFYDRTNSSQTSTRKKKAQVASTTSSAARLEAARMDLYDLKTKIAEMEKEAKRKARYVDELKGASKGKKSKGDSLDAFMRTVDKSLKSESAKRAEMQLNSLRESIRHYKQALAFKEKQSAGKIAIKPKKTPRRTRRSDMPMEAEEVRRRKEEEADEDSPVEDFRMKKDEPVVSMSSVMARMPAMKQKLKTKIEERKKQFQEEGKAKKGKKKRTKKLKGKVANRGEDDERTEETKEEVKVEAPAPVKNVVKNEAVREKFKALFEKMKKEEETAATLTRLPAMSGEQQSGLIVRKRKKKGNDDKRATKAPRRSTIGPAIVPTKTKEDYEEWQDVTWAPPKNQTGDGRTHLNAKYGY